MGILQSLRSLFASPAREERPGPTGSVETQSTDLDKEIEMLAQEELRKHPTQSLPPSKSLDETRADMEELRDRFATPSDLHDGGAWDRYWMKERELRLLDVGLNDRMASDDTLPDLLRRRGARTILCVGSGLSIEPLSLALLGFDVTILELSGAIVELLSGNVRSPERPVSHIPGFRVREDGSLSLGPPGPIDSDRFKPPAMHRRPDQPAEGGGSLAFVAGDLTDPAACPGPFDVVIERRTVQLFQGTERTEALDRVVARLGERGTLVSHEHSGGWRPDEPRTHFAEAWLRERGFVLRGGVSPQDAEAAPRLAVLTFTSG